MISSVGLSETILLVLMKLSWVHCIWKFFNQTYAEICNELPMACDEAYALVETNWTKKCTQKRSGTKFKDWWF